MRRRAPTVASPRVSERRGVLLAFVVFGLFWGTWAAALPDVRERSGLGDGRLGLAIAAIAVAAVPTMPLAGRLADRWGPRRLLPGALLGLAAAALLLGLAGPPVALVPALLLLGAATGTVDVVVNTATAAWERVESDRLMSVGHGFFSVGVLTGASLTGLARQAGSGPLLVLGTAGAAIALVAVTQPAYRRPVVEPGQATGPRGRRRLAPVLVGIGAVVAATFLVEDAVQSWSALHLERTLHAPPWQSGLAPGLFATAMAVGRLSGHLLRPEHEARVLATGGSVTAVGLVVLAAAPVSAVGLAGAVVVGAGLSVLAPTLLSAAAARSAPGRQGADLALVSTCGYAGFVVGPPLVGLLSAALSLPVALGLLVVLAVVVATAGPVLLRGPRACPGAEGAGSAPTTPSDHRSA